MTDGRKLPEMARCFYCGKGRVEALPAKCPSCSAELTKLVEEMTPTEFNQAMAKNCRPTYYLAS